jgi:tRNA threonylcarbamoyladenosine biosynthesis protein TsaB
MTIADAEYNIDPIGVAVLILALDTTSRAGSLAVLRERDVLAEVSGDETITHGQRLPLEFKRICERAGVPLSDIDLFAVAAGPGSFTGLRVGIAAIQGLAFAFRRLVVPVSTLEAVAATAGKTDAPVAAWVDAQRGEVFAQIFPHGDRAMVGTPERVLAAWRNDPSFASLRFQGDGAVRYAARIQAVAGPTARVATETRPLAAAIGGIALNDPDRAVLPHAIVPIYVRKPDAELARDRRSASS